MTPFLRKTFLTVLLLAMPPALALAQDEAAAPAAGSEVAFGGMKGDPKLPVEITSDTLEVNQNDGVATFTGNVIVIQGALRMAAPVVKVLYSKDDKSSIETVTATGGVTLVDGRDEAEGKDAVYTVATGIVVMTGDVILTQGKNTMAGQKLTADLNDGTGRMEGRVKTVLKPKGN